MSVSSSADTTLALSHSKQRASNEKSSLLPVEKTIRSDHKRLSSQLSSGKKRRTLLKSLTSWKKAPLSLCTKYAKWHFQLPENSPTNLSDRWTIKEATNQQSIPCPRSSPSSWELVSATETPIKKENEDLHLMTRHLQRSLSSEVRRSMIRSSRAQSTGSSNTVTNNKPGRKMKHRKSSEENAESTSATSKTDSASSTSSTSGDAASKNVSSQTYDTASTTSTASTVKDTKSVVAENRSMSSEDLSKKLSYRSVTIENTDAPKIEATEKSTLEFTLTHEVEYEVRKVDPKEGDKEYRVQILRHRLQNIVKKLIGRKHRSR